MLITTIGAVFNFKHKAKQSLKFWVEDLYLHCLSLVVYNVSHVKVVDLQMGIQGVENLPIWAIFCTTSGNDCGRCYGLSISIYFNICGFG